MPRRPSRSRASAAPRALKKPKRPKGREALERVMERALEVARAGGCAGFNDVRSKLSEADRTALSLWAGAEEADRIDRECQKARAGVSSEVRERERRKRK